MIITLLLVAWLPSLEIRGCGGTGEGFLILWGFVCYSALFSALDNNSHAWIIFFFFLNSQQITPCSCRTLFWLIFVCKKTQFPFPGRNSSEKHTRQWEILRSFEKSNTPKQRFSQTGEVQMDFMQVDVAAWGLSELLKKRHHLTIH